MLVNFQIEPNLRAMPSKKRCRSLLDMEYTVCKRNILEEATLLAAVVVTPLS
jgi:hypothetical protein